MISISQPEPSSRSSSAKILALRQLLLKAAAVMGAIRAFREVELCSRNIEELWIQIQTKRKRLR